MGSFWTGLHWMQLLTMAMDALGLGIRVLLLLTVANSTPIVLKHLLGERWSAPLDFGCRFPDGRPWLGPSKTWRGLACAVLASALAAPLLGFPMACGGQLGLLAMVGDAIASFTKRRLGIASSGRSFGLDQILEALVPLVAMQAALAIPWTVVAGVTVAFLLLETPVARLSNRLGLRDRPY